MICHEVMCSILYIWFVLNHYSIVCYVQKVYIILTHVRKAMEHEGTGEQSTYQCVHLLSHHGTMSLDMGKPIDLLSQTRSNVEGH